MAADKSYRYTSRRVYSQITAMPVISSDVSPKHPICDVGRIFQNLIGFKNPPYICALQILKFA